MQENLCATPDDEEPNIKEIYPVLDPELAAIVGGNYIELAGTLLVPVLDDLQHVVGAARTTESQRGFSQGVVVHVSTEEIIPGQSFSRYQICYWLWFASLINANDSLHQTTTGLRALGPIEDTILSVPALDTSETGLFLPGSDDKRAEAIDLAVCNVSILLQDLQDAFSGTGEIPSLASATEIEVSYYERYLSSMFTLSQMEIALSTGEILTETPDRQIVSLAENDEVYDMNSDGELFLGFKYLPQIDQLCFVVDAGMNMKEAYVPLNEIIKLYIKR